jgi:pyrroloquinoline quinone (PQQ) biosynthesis protein C
MNALSPRNDTHSAGPVKTILPGQAAVEIVDYYERLHPITDHPLFVQMRAAPVDLTCLWRLLANFQISISRNFARRLASIAARVDDETIRCILAEQLNDEMGNGQIERAHVNLFSSMMQQLEPWKPRVMDDAVFEPGRRLDAQLAQIYGAEDVFESVGAVIAGEIFGKQMDAFLADEFRRQSDVEASKLDWLMLHEQLEVEHADSSIELARRVPHGSQGAAWQGALKLKQAGDTFLDDVLVASGKSM